MAYRRSQLDARVYILRWPLSLEDGGGAIDSKFVSQDNNFQGQSDTKKSLLAYCWNVKETCGRDTFLMSSSAKQQGTA